MTERRFTAEGDITVVVRGEICEEQVQEIIAEERERWREKGKPLAKIEMTADGDEIEVRSFERSPIKRIRRITGYLSEVDNWNAAKRAELADRLPHDEITWRDIWG
jgi:anaerobic ribonucleoside-triphosphate reductase activating protein